MPRSSLLNALMRIAADVDSARRPARPVGWGPKIGRRAALRGAASLAGMVPALAAAEARVAIVGAGLAGLTAANELSKAGLEPVVHEGSTRLGGRCFSSSNSTTDRSPSMAASSLTAPTSRSGASLRRSACRPIYLQ